jgi:rubrerythrin
MRKQDLAGRQIEELLHQALETELGGVEVYRMALLCTDRAELKEEWERYLEQTEEHVDVVRGIFGALGLDAEATTPGRQILREKTKALLSAMQKALKDAPLAAELTAAESIVDAETKDHANWQLIGALGAATSGEAKKVLTEAFEAVGAEEDEHLNHTKGWCREMWRESIGLPATIPPPEEDDRRRTQKAAGKRVQSKSGDGKRPESRA